MKINNTGYAILVLLTACSACNKETATSIVSSRQISNATTITTESFESGTKASYTAGNVTLSTGSWNFDDALLGNSSSDRKNGSQSARIRNTGKLTMNFNFTSGASTVTIKHAKFGSDGTST
ncbi:MAG TPA: DNA/RNA non-specific endonuclease, partial [Parafilimonas sp.]